MPWNGSGVFNRIYSWVADAAAAIDINATRMDTDTDDIVTGLNNTRTLDGQTKPSAALPMNGFNHTGVGNATAATHYAAAGQIQSNSLLFAAATGTADAITATFSPATASLTDGEQHYVRAATANATTTPTYAPDGLTAHTITRWGGAALVAGDIVANQELILRYNIANTRWELLNPHNLSLRDTSAAHDVPIIATSSVTLTANRTLTLDVANADRTLKLTGNLTGNQDVSTAGSPTFADLTIGTASGTATVNLNGPGSGNLVTVAGANTQFKWNTTAIWQVDAANFYLPNAGTTASAPNAYIDNSNNNNVVRSTSSLAAKTELRPITVSEARSILRRLNPFSYRSKAKADDPRRRFYGLGAEHVAEVTDMLVHPGKDGKPDGVMYDRLGVLNLVLTRNHDMRLRAMEFATLGLATALVATWLWR